MNENKFLINQKFDDAISKYNEMSKKNKKIDNEEFIDYVIKCLVFIYGDLDLINPHITKNNKALLSNLTKYGYPENKITDFIEQISQLECNYDNIIRELIDMYQLKTTIIVSEKEKEYFWNLLENTVLPRSKNAEYFYNYYNSKFANPKIEKEIEFLEIESELFEDKNKKSNTNFQLGFAGGYVSIMTILFTIALVCIGITVINFLVG